MDPASEESRVAWQPLTPPGIAAFAHASTNRLLLVQLVFAAVASVAVAWFVATGWFPTVSQAIRGLPPEGQIRSGTLDWRGDSTTVLAEDRFLSIAVDLQHEGEARSPAHVNIEFGRDGVKIFSLLGYIELFYPKLLTVSFNRNELEPWW